jgi:replicative DNA helicase
MNQPIPFRPNQPNLPNLPEAIETEKLVLGVLLNDPDATQAILALTRDEFYIEQHKRIFEAARWCFDNGRDITCHTVYQRLADQRYDASVGGLTYLTSLIVPHIIGLKSHIDTLVQKSRLRRLAIGLHEFSEECCMPDAGPETIRKAEAFLRVYAELGGQDLGLIGLAEAVKAAGGMTQFLAPVKGAAVPTPWTGLNNLLSGGGFLPGQLIVIGARPGLGKSALAAVIARTAKDVGVAFFSLEMSAREIWFRMIASEAGISLKSLVEGTILEGTADRKKISAIASEFSESPLMVDDCSGTNVAAIVAAVKRTKGVRLVIVDYMQILRSRHTRQSRVEEVGEISRSLKIAATELQVPIVVLSQLNRESTKDDRPPELHDLRESGSIEMDANTVMFLHANRKELREAIDNRLPNELDLIIRKQRNGPVGTVKLMFDPAKMRIWEKKERKV